MGIGGLKSPRRIWPTLLLWVVTACAAPAARDVAVGTPAVPAASRAGASAAELLEIVKTLAAPEMEGRATGSPGMRRAAQFIAGEFERAGRHSRRKGGTAIG
jgi:hypothetical protein